MKVNKLITVFLIILILFTYLPVYALQDMDFLKYGTPSKTDWDNALHFIVKHWHADEDAQNNLEEKDDQNIDIVEGYIVPKAENGGYDFYYVDQKGGNINSLETNKSDYVSSTNNKDGTITLPIKTIQDSEGNPIEHFSGISISAGHSALDSEDNNIVISYQKNVHLVKAHVFYSNEKITVYGSGKDDAVFGNTDKEGNDEKDTDFVYTYKTTSNEHTAGDVVKNGDKPVYDISNLPSDVFETDVEKNKVYSTLEGLHTDKTASAVVGDNRKFDLDLEAWYSGAPLADIGLVLDASGSMGFTSDDLKRININDLNLNDDVKKQLESKKLSKEKYTEENTPTNEDWLNDIFLTEDDINLMLNPHNTDNSKLSASDYSYFIFDPRNTVNEYVPLGYWDGSVKGVKDKLIGYYEFNKGNYDSNVVDKRDWLINSVNGESASLVKQVKTQSANDNISFEEADLPSNWSSDKRIKLDNSKGLNIKNDSGAEASGGGVGVLLDAKPTSNNFTISFSIQKDTTKGADQSDEQNYADIIYIGKQNSTGDDIYYRGIRDGRKKNDEGKITNNSNRFRGYSDNLSTKITDINNVFSKDKESHIITLVFSGGKLTSYCDSDIGVSNNSLNNTEVSLDLSGYDIIFKGFDNNYNGADLFVDNIAVFDAALTSEEVSTIQQIIKSESSNEYTVCNECFLDNNSEESIGVVSNYFVGLNGGTPGWYYVNYDSEWTNEYYNEEIQSCKRYWGIPKNGVDESQKEKEVTYTDKISEEVDSKLKEIDTGFTYKPEKSTPIEFYIDSAGYLRCFFTSSTKPDTANTSFVYFKDDSNYVKTEALQHALGSFTSMLDEVSPNSKISAVRFNTDKIEDDDLDKLVLLDWTNDPIEEQDIMSLNRGNGGTVQGTDSIPNSQNEEDKAIKQYNYGLTGGTATLKGLKAFKKYLSEDVDKNADKYLIIFTDGKDSTEEKEQAESEEIAKELKEKGYTIFAVMLTGGSVEVSSDTNSDYYKAKEFLLKLVGNSETDSGVGEEKKDSYFYSTAEESDSIDALTEIFTDEILNRITYNLYNYNVEDYIDPRFDLVSADNKIYTLNAEGKITIKNSDGTIYGGCDLQNGTSLNEGTQTVNTEIDGTKHYITINLSNSSKVEKSAHNARLYYDNNKKMYYLKWVDQTIPGCTPDSKRLSVWNAKFTIKAKDDFIGGNAVLTNGNEASMNWVYSDKDTNKSSGTQDAVLPKEESTPETGSESTPEVSALDEVAGSPEETKDEYPSKGFPRVTVNVPATKDEFSEEQIIYMGETINQEQLSEKLMQDTYNKIANTNTSFYLEYLSRYATKNSGTVSLDTLKETLKKGQTLTIPYYYLPNSSNTTQTGTEAHEQDPLGILEYKVEPEGDNYYPEGGIIKDTNARKLIFTVKFIPLNIDEKEPTETESLDVKNMEEASSESEKDSQKEVEELKNKSRKELNNTLVKEEVYKWNKEYKPVVGNELTENELIKGEHQTKEVSGEIALQLVLTKDVREVIGDQELTYSIDLMRQNEDNKEKVGTFTAKYKKSDYPEIDEETDTTTENSETDPAQNADTTIPSEGSEQTALPSNPTTPDGEVPETTPDENKKTYKLDENGNLIILAKIKYEDKDEYMEQYGLPIGTYTVENAKINDLSSLKFELPITIKQTEQYNAELFTVGSNHEIPQTYIASLGENNEIILGKKDTEKTYTDYCFGLLQVTPITYFELPETGKNSLLQLYFLISIFTITGISIQIIKRKK